MGSMIDILEARKPQIHRVGADAHEMACEKQSLAGAVSQRACVFCDHNHERKEALAGFAGMVNFAREVHSSVMSPVWKLAKRKRHVGPLTATKEKVS